MSTGKLIILSAPSGTGKTSVCRNLLQRNPKWKIHSGHAGKAPAMGQQIPRWHEHHLGLLKLFYSWTHADDVSLKK